MLVVVFQPMRTFFGVAPLLTLHKKSQKRHIFTSKKAPFGIFKSLRSWVEFFFFKNFWASQNDIFEFILNLPVAARFPKNTSKPMTHAPWTPAKKRQWPIATACGSSTRTYSWHSLAQQKWIGLRSKRGEELSLSMCWLSGQAETPHELHFISGLPLGYARPLAILQFELCPFQVRPWYWRHFDTYCTTSRKA